MPVNDQGHLDVTILIVDDDPSIITAISKTLHTLGRIIFAVDGPNAIKLAEAELPDVILLDAEMPGISGFEVCTTLKQNKDTAHIPILFITSHVSQDFEAEVFDNGAADYISKPLNAPVVLARARLQLNYKRELEKLERLSLTDSLTGLNNRRSFDEKILTEFKLAQRNSTAISLLMLDIDEFKKYNDHFGHVMGDSCIQQVTKVLIDSTRRPGDFVARYGGEEFAIILPNTDLAGAEYFAEKILENMLKLNIPHTPAAQRALVSLSIGYDSLIPTQHDLPASLLQNSDTLLFKAKANGRACVCGPQEHVHRRKHSLYLTSSA